MDWGRERGTGSDSGSSANRNTGANGRAAGERMGLIHAMQTHEHWHTHMVRPSVPDNSSVNQWESKERCDGSLSKVSWKYVSEKN